MEFKIKQVMGKVLVTILEIEGNVDGSNYQSLIGQAQKLYDEGSRSLLLDLTKIPYMSSSGIVALHKIALLFRSGIKPNVDDGWAALHEAVEENDDLQKNLKLLNPQPKVDKTLEMTGMKKFFEIFLNVNEAVASF